MLDDIQKTGEEAARNGLSLLDCPYLKAAAMPAHTGESPGDWIQRVAAWEKGWKKELAQRGARRSASPFAVSAPKRPLTARFLSFNGYANISAPNGALFNGPPEFAKLFSG